MIGPNLCAPKELALPRTLNGSYLGRRNRCCPLGVKDSLAVDTAIGVRSKVVALPLREIRREVGGAIRIEIVERCAVRGNGHANGASQRNDVAASARAGIDPINEVGRKQQIFEFRIFAEGVPDGIEQFGADDAAALPDARDLSEI